jgi:UMF1 family MFS transporter
MRAEKPNVLTIVSWSFYDFANTIFSMNVISLYFALWVTVDKGGADILYSVILSGSMLAVALSVPVYGAISDHTGRRRLPLAVLTLICVSATAAIGFFDQLGVGRCLFFIANYCYQSSMVFYNGMLPEVSRGANVGLVSGYGVALGYLGSVVGLLAVKPFVAEGGRLAAFIPTALMFFVFALPCLIFNKDFSQKNVPKLQFGETFLVLKNTYREASKYKNLIKFVLIHFLILDVVNTIVAFMAVYANKVIGFDDNQINTFMIIATLTAMLGSFGVGWLVKEKGNRISYWAVLILWAFVLLLAVFSQTEAMFWAVGPLAGIGMGGVWVVSRSFLIELAPKEKVGEFFGLYGLAGKMSSIFGPLIWGTVVWIFSSTETFKYRAAVFVLFLISCTGILFYKSLSKDLKALEA